MAIISRTTGPIHFEDLEPHKFEDVIRQLAYDFRDWQSIEATGRSGSDDGYDVRAYEKVIKEDEIEKDSEEDTNSPMDGNLWMIQVKREQEIGPTRIKEILDEVNVDDIPYGYILAAPVNFSKKSFDVFREELRKKGVVEFQLWGRAAIEDMLYQPKNDRILFSVLGISFATRKRSRTSEIRSIVIVKNKLLKLLGDQSQIHKDVLIRDLDDYEYPYQDEYSDFDTKPRWREYVAAFNYPEGILFKSHEYYCYFDPIKKEYDCFEDYDLVRRKVADQFKEHETIEQNRLRIKELWDFLPQENRGLLSTFGFVKYSDISLVDEKGDVLFDMPHIFVRFAPHQTPFSGGQNFLESNGKKIRLKDDYKKVDYFASIKKAKQFGNYLKDPIILTPEATDQLKRYFDISALYDQDDKYKYLNIRDIIKIQNSDVTGLGEIYIQVTFKRSTPVKKYLEEQGDEFKIKSQIQAQLGKEITDEETINVTEVRKLYKWEIEKNGITIIS